MTTREKQLVLRQWQTFLKYGCKWEHFTDTLYGHLTLHCSFVAHYDKRGFYADYFTSGDDRARFLSQFDKRNAKWGGAGCEIPPSVEYGMTDWARGDYADINLVMIEVASEYIPSLIAESKARQREADIAKAEALLDKYGIKLQRFPME